MKNLIGLCAVTFLTCLLATGCQAASVPQTSGLPEEAKEALAKWVQEYQTNVSYEYEILSAQKGSPQTSGLGETPDEVWCVTLDREINVFSHFLIGRFGLLWQVMPLYTAQENQFLKRGCSNW